MALRLLSDFDGVWTDQGPEAEFIWGFAVAELARLCGIPVERAAARCVEELNAAQAEPTLHGWAPGGRLSAYVDEDPLLRTNAALARLAEAPDEEARGWWRQLATQGFADHQAFGDHCFRGGSTAFRREHPPILVEEAQATAAAILALGVEFHVVSNSAPNKVVSWLREAGIDAGVEEGHPVRVHGDARKWFLDGEADAIELGGRRVDVSRPAYAKILDALQPDLIIGDVFSLDLALPHARRRRGEGHARLVLRRHPHTPTWSEALANAGAIDDFVAHPRELEGLLEGLRDDERARG